MREEDDGLYRSIREPLPLNPRVVRGRLQKPKQKKLQNGLPAVLRIHCRITPRSRSSHRTGFRNLAFGLKNTRRTRSDP
jgi:hypothetical protein